MHINKRCNKMSLNIFGFERKVKAHRFLFVYCILNALTTCFEEWCMGKGSYLGVIDI